MKKYSIVFAIIAIVLVMSSVGCDNRTQLEKDADAAAKKLNNALR